MWNIWLVIHIKHSSQQIHYTSFSMYSSEVFTKDNYTLTIESLLTNFSHQLAIRQKKKFTNKNKKVENAMYLKLMNMLLNNYGTIKYHKGKQEISWT